jgi:hypothetical protein
VFLVGALRGWLVEGVLVSTIMDAPPLSWSSTAQRVTGLGGPAPWAPLVTLLDEVGHGLELPQHVRTAQSVGHLLVGVAPPNRQ